MEIDCPEGRKHVMEKRIEQFKTVKLWYEPRRNLQNKRSFTCEMSDDDHAFLCGIIKEIRPEKIVEIGVAEGGTTAVIMESLFLLGMESRVYSVDLNRELYCNREKETGYVWKEVCNDIPGKSMQEFKLGETIAGCIDEISNEIDLAIIDTTHILPGEILDFLCILPYLKRNATVLLHDISLNWIRCFSDDTNLLLRARDSIATKVLYTVVTADKWFYFDKQPFNIAAFTINDDTVKYIGDCFQALSLTWGYMPSEEMLFGYRRIFLRYYNEQCMEFFDTAIKANEDMGRADVLRQCVAFVKMKKQELKEAQEVIVYGAGMAAAEIIRILQKEKVNVLAVGISSRNFNKRRVCGIEVKTITQLLEYRGKKLIIASIIDEYIEKMEQKAKNLGFTDILKIEKVFI